MTAAEDLLRSLAPQVLASLLRTDRDLHACEDAVQEALLDAATSWPSNGPPDEPRAWLLTVARRRLVDRARSDSSRRAREERDAASVVEPGDVAHADDTLLLLLLCCHPALTPPSQIALTLRAVGGLTTAEIASAFLVPEATMAQRISRAKQKIADAGGRFERPAPDEVARRLPSVMHVLYLMFNEGYVGDAGLRVDLTDEAIRLTRQLRAEHDDDEITGLLALMLLHDARRAARVDDDGALVALADQDRSRWDGDQIAEAVAMVEAVLARGPVGEYQLQAAIAAVHCESASAEETDWLQILGLYDLLQRITDNPVVRLNRAVAAAHVLGPDVALAELDVIAADRRLAGNHRVDAVRGQVLEMAGRRAEAREAFTAAASATRSAPERVELLGRAARLS